MGKKSLYGADEGTYTIDDLRAAFDEGYEVGHEDGRSPCAAGKLMPGGGGAYDPQDPDRVWQDSETYRNRAKAPPSPPSTKPDHVWTEAEAPLDPFTAATRAMSGR